MAFKSQYERLTTCSTASPDLQFIGLKKSPWDIGMERVVDSLRTKINRLVDNRICIGVTGLSRSGKSTFICSLINQLKQHDAPNAQLGAFSASLNSAIHSVELHPLEDRSLPMFDYNSAIAGLSGKNPKWPKSTTDISGILIKINLIDTGLFGKPTYKTVWVEIRDYPGEWLVDLPMRKMSFQEWSAFIDAQLSQSPRATMEGNPRENLAGIDPLAEYDAQTLADSLNRYHRFLRTCKEHHPPLSMLQPGRFLQPDQYAERTLTHFVPLINCANLKSEVLKKAPDNSFFKVLEKRFEEYKKVCINDFFREFISPVNRQVILVDVLNVLNGGQAYVEDMIEALDMISTSFNYGSGWFSSGIERVHFVATKVDQTLNEHHENAKRLLDSIVKRTTQRIRQHETKRKVRVKTQTSAVAAIRCSENRTLPNMHQHCVFASDMAGKKIKYTPPPIPDHIPHDAEWAAFLGWEWPQLGPPQNTRVSQDQAIQHIRMDSLLQSLIGDLCE